MAGDSLELLELNLKLAGRKEKKSVLVSAGKLADKERLLPAFRELSAIGLNLLATEGTSRFLTDNGVANQRVHKIAEGAEPNIRSLLRSQRFDLVINILTGDDDYDEQSDSRIIRSLSIEAGIPIFTDVETAELMIGRIVRDVRAGRFDTSHAGMGQAWNLRDRFMAAVRERGGFANHHAHFDKAYLITHDTLKLGQVDMQRKWTLYKHLKENYTHEDLVQRISRGVEVMISQGARYCRTMVDADSTVKLLPVEAALEVKRKYADKIQLDIGVQVLQGVLDASSRRWYELACEKADFCGGLPSRDRPTPEKHLDIVLQIAKSLGKMLDVHVDQENNPHEMETEMLAIKTAEHGMEGRVFAVHAISMAARDESEQKRIARRLKDSGVGVICCPSAALSMKSLAMTAPLHNSIAPVPLLLAEGVDVYLGVDNVYDLFMPFTDGDMWFECRLLMEACRFYDLEAVADLATKRLKPAVASPRDLASIQREVVTA